MKTKHVFFILCIIIILAVAGYAFGLFKLPSVNSPVNFNFLSNSQQEAVQKVKTLYEVTNPGTNITVSKIDEVSGMYKVLFKVVDNTGAVTYRETYITKDGELMSENMVLINQSISQITKIHNFVDCLDNKNVKIFGISNHTGTVLQFNILGGVYSTKLYVSCDGDLAQQCVNIGVDTVPSVFYKNKAYSGVQSLESLQNLTSCAL